MREKDQKGGVKEIFFFALHTSFFLLDSLLLFPVGYRAACFCQRLLTAALIQLTLLFSLFFFFQPSF